MNNIELLYASFSMFLKPVAIDGCECCLDAKQITLLLNKELSEISAEEISSYASSVFLTVGSKSDFMYFFPRILELSLTDKFCWPDPEVVFNAVVNSDYETWSNEQKNIVNKLLKSKFVDLLSLGEDGCDIDQWLAAIARIEPNISHYLQLLENDKYKSAFCKFVDWNADTTSNRLSNGFWEECKAQEQQVITWLRQGKAAKFLNDKYRIRI